MENVQEAMEVLLRNIDNNAHYNDEEFTFPHYQVDYTDFNQFFQPTQTVDNANTKAFSNDSNSNTISEEDESDEGNDYVDEVNLNTFIIQQTDFSRYVAEEEDYEINLKNNGNEEPTLITVGDPLRPTKRGGRRKKNSPCIDSSIGHTKTSKDNIRRKIKVKFIHFIIDFFNLLIKIKCNGHQKNKFRTFDNVGTKDITVKTNLSISLIPMRDFLMQNVSLKFNHCNKNQNISTVTALVNQKDKTLDYYLNMTVKQFYNTVFLSNPLKLKSKFKPFIKGFETKTDEPKFFSECLEKENDESYREAMKIIGHLFFEYFETTTPRKRNKNKNKNQESFFDTTDLLI